MAIKLGQTGKDLITGFEGLCVGQAQYLTGCNQVYLVPRSLSAEGKRREGEWFDEQRIVAVGEEILVLPGGAAAAVEKPGCDEQLPPTR